MSTKKDLFPSAVQKLVADQLRLGQYSKIVKNMMGIEIFPAMESYYKSLADYKKWLEPIEQTKAIRASNNYFLTRTVSDFTNITNYAKPSYALDIEDIYNSFKLIREEQLKFSKALSGINYLNHLSDSSLMPPSSYFDSKAYSNIGATNSLFTQWRNSIVDSQQSSIITHLTPPVREQYLTSRHIQSFSNEGTSATEKDAEIIVDIDKHISLILPELIDLISKDAYIMWNGAWNAFKSNNPDRIRHTLTSIRELLTHIIHMLAPDHEIKEWSSEETFYYNSKPTRKARLLYILRNTNDEHLSAYYQQEINTWITFFDILNKGTHQLAPQYTDIQIQTFFRKAHSIICTLVEITKFPF